MDDRFESADYRRSRAAYTAQCTVEYFSAIIVEDAFLAKVLKEVGMTDATIGIIATLVTFSNLFQLLTLILLRHLKNVKGKVLLYDSLSILLLGAVYAIPFLNVSRPVRTILVFLCIGGGYFFKYLVASLLYSWGNAFVHPLKRGSFSAGKEMISLGTGVVFTLAVGFAVDRFEAAGQLRTGFIFLGVVMLILEIADAICILMIKDADAEDTKRQRKTFREILDQTFRNRGFVCILILQSMFTIGSCATGGFLGTYKTGELMMTVGLTQVIGMCGSLARILVSKPFGRYSDRTSFTKGYSLGLLIAAAAYLFVVFTTPGTRWLIVGYTVLYTIAMAGINANGYNITYSYVPADCFAQAAAIKASVVGIVGFLSSLVASRVLQAIQERGNVFLGIPNVYGQQVLALFSFFMMLAAFLFSKLVLGKLKVMKQ